MMMTMENQIEDSTIRGGMFEKKVARGLGSGPGVKGTLVVMRRRAARRPGGAL